MNGMLYCRFLGLSDRVHSTDAKIPLITKKNVQKFNFSLADTPILIEVRTEAIIGY